MSTRVSHQCFRIASGSDGRRYKSDFTTIKKMTDFSYMKMYLRAQSTLGDTGSLKFYFIFSCFSGMNDNLWIRLATPYNIAQQSWIQQLWMTESTDISKLVTRVRRVFGQRVVTGRDFMVSPGNHPLTKKPEDFGYEIEKSATIINFTIPPTWLIIKPSRVWVVRDQLNPG